MLALAVRSGLARRTVIEIEPPAGDGSGWSRLPHTAVCPAQDATSVPPELAGLRRTPAVNTRRRIDASGFALSAAAPPAVSAHGARRPGAAPGCAAAPDRHSDTPRRVRRTPSEGFPRLNRIRLALVSPTENGH
ncbi:DUF6083 domain-containing protein [Streptomyces sp. T12]|uniref:DUF6083 domain-containing protein n=1 Tax=Streptomyces sp. T12 TaxID=477697 RepID=UPI0023657B4E|nr:DUF6083 domain-containing protein [Streptomyces sp. T12]WDF35332.1 DUF6083 domain-containing protein [Streptomyces sp. T12]